MNHREIKLAFALPAKTEQSGVSMLMNKSQSDSIWKKKVTVLFSSYMQLRCCIIFVLYLPVEKDRVWQLELSSSRPPPDIVPNFSKNEDSGKRKFQTCVLTLSFPYCFTMRGPSIATSWQIIESSSAPLCEVNNIVISDAQSRDFKSSLILSWDHINVASVPLEVWAGRMQERLQRFLAGCPGLIAKQLF